jgi:NAD(P)-dependent dehydrogenase (short-subunit alcohol dehydrogenase family)
MKEFKDKVAVVTGAASGIGRGMAERCAQEGMQVVLADPVELQNPVSDQPASPALEAVIQSMSQAVEAGLSPEQVAEHVFSAIKEDKFYILTHPEFNPAIQTRMENVLQGRNPA